MLFNVMKLGENDDDDTAIHSDKNFMKQISSGTEKKLTKESKYK